MPTGWNFFFTEGTSKKYFSFLCELSFASPLGDQVHKDSYGPHHVEPYHEGSDNFQVVPLGLNTLPRRTMSRGDSVPFLLGCEDAEFDSVCIDLQLFLGQSKTAIFPMLTLRASSAKMFDTVKNNRIKKCLSRACSFLRYHLFPSPAQYRVKP